MKHLFIRFLLFYLFFIGISPINAQHRKSANPILSGFHADPEILYSRQTKRYYIYPTSDGFPGWGGSYFKVFSSRNLKGNINTFFITVQILSLIKASK